RPAGLAPKSISDDGQRGLTGRLRSKAKRGGLTADLIVEACAYLCGSWLACDGGVSANTFID
ncbi:hypothetical protein, partial [Pseudomonas sp. VB3]|uniref:hypothetical protein n=1 Tax=Pseudomonas sp. VB3 TaxID=2994641 RepID=UPI0022EC6627